MDARYEGEVALAWNLAADPADTGAWREYLAALDLLLRLEDRLARQASDARAVLTTKEMADRLGISVKTLLARKKRGHVRPAVAHGKAFGWRVEDAFR